MLCVCGGNEIQQYQGLVIIYTPMVYMYIVHICVMYSSIIHVCQYIVIIVWV